MWSTALTEHAANVLLRITIKNMFEPGGIVRRATVAIAAKGLGSLLALVVGVVVARLLGCI